MFVNTVREMVSIELGKEIEKDVFRLVTSVGERKKFWVPMRNRIPRSDAPPLSHRDPRVARSIRNRNFPDVQIFVRSTDIYRRGYLSDDIKIFKRGSQLICLYGAISVVSASKVDQNLWEHNVLISSWIWVGKTKEGSKQTKNNNRQFARNTRSSGALKCKFLFSLILLSRMNFSWSSAHNP